MSMEFDANQHSITDRGYGTVLWLEIGLPQRHSILALKFDWNIGDSIAMVNFGLYGLKMTLKVKFDIEFEITGPRT